MGAFPRTVVAAVAIVVCSAFRADALDPRKALGDYTLTSWNQREGLPWGPIYALAQTPDGYLWVPTANGLLRFDGYRFAPWRPLPGESMPDAYATALHTARDGSLWIGFIDGRVSQIRDGHIVNYSASHGLASRRVRALVDAADGTMWIWHDPVGVSTLRNGVGRLVQGDDGVEIGAKCLFQDSRDRMWICANGAAVWNRDQQRFVTIPSSHADTYRLVEDAPGRILGLSFDGTLRVIEGGPFDGYASLPPIPNAIQSIAKDRHGNLWFATTRGGLYRVRNDGAARLEQLAKANGLSSDVALSLREDRDGNLWIGTSNGLNRLREGKLGSITRLARRTSVLAHALTALPDGSVWVATAAGLTRFETDGDRAVERETVLADHVATSLRYDGTNDALWVGTLAGVAVFSPSRSSPPRSVTIADFTLTHGIARGRTGRLWLADGTKGVHRWDPGQGSAPMPVGRRAAAFAALVDRHDNAWMGYDDGQLLKASGGTTRTYSTDDGLSGGPVRSIYEDRSGTLWVGTDRGLARLDGDRFTTLTRAHGLPADYVSEIIEDDTGTFWLGTGAGIVRVGAGELDKAAARPGYRVALTLYDARDGLRGMPAHAGNPGVTRTRDGRLWFLTQNGIAIVDPTRTDEKRAQLPVHIEAIGADDVLTDLSRPVRLPPRTRNVTIDYTAPDLSEPDRVQFKYRMEGWEDDWRDVGGRRQAFYNDLAPGDYRFRVIASNSDGVWNEAGATAAFTVLPAFHQTRVFQAIVASVLILAAWGAHRVRLWQIARRLHRQFETRVAERARIAEELHDTLIQDLAALNFQAEIVDDQLPHEPDGAKHTLSTLRARMQRVVSDGRRGMTQLHVGVTESGDLAQALSRAAQELRGPGGPSFHVVVQGHPRSLHPLVGDEIYRIAREAVGNAFRHAAARRIDVEVSFTSHDLRVRVHDDGHGIAEDVLQTGRPGHFGLHGMRERARQIGATLRVWSRVDVGTEVALIVPGRSAFQSAD